MTTATVTVLTAEDVSALRKAESVTFHLNTGGFFSGIRVSLRSYTGDQRIYTATEQRLFPQPDSGDRQREIVPAENTAGGFTEHASHVLGGHGTECFHMIHSAQYDQEWLTVAGLLKAGDEIHLNWTADAHTNGLMRDNSLHGDRLRLCIVRPSKVRLMFAIATSVSYDNSARMVRLVPSC